MKTGGHITEAVERDLLRLLTDPTGEQGLLARERAADLRRQIARDPHLAARFRRMRHTWEGLELAPPQPLPPGFAQRIAARAAAERGAAEAPFGWGAAPGWVRMVGALALASGIVTGSKLLSVVPALPSGTASQIAAEGAGGAGELTLVELEPSLAEAYILALEELEGRPSPSSDAGDSMGETGVVR